MGEIIGSIGIGKHQWLCDQSETKPRASIQSRPWLNEVRVPMHLIHFKIRFSFPPFAVLPDELLVSIKVGFVPYVALKGEANVSGFLLIKNVNNVSEIT